MRILTRYILREVTAHALIGVGIFTFVLFTRDLGRILELVVRASRAAPQRGRNFLLHGAARAHLYTPHERSGWNPDRAEPTCSRQ